MYLLFLLASPFHKKAKKWISGRKNYFTILKTNIPEKKGKRLWVHCASLGEFEQAKPIIEKWLNNKPDWTLIVTFFSPSGFEMRKNYKQAEWVGYMALDTKKNAKQFIELTKPDMVFFVKYEFWFFHLSQVIKNKIPLYLISATFRENHYIFKSFGKKTKEILKQFNQLFLQNEESYELLKKANFTNIYVTGDTRYDRVMAQAKLSEDVPKIMEWKEDRKTIVLGSSWKEEENIMASFLKEHKTDKVIIAPHEIGLANIEKIESLFSFTSTSRYSNIDVKSQVLIIDSIGLLSRLYKYGDVAIVGGGFGRGLHNILEPLSYGLPVFFGPLHDKYPEAQKAIDAGISFELKKEFNLELELPNKEKVRNYLNNNLGATDKVYNYINKEK